MAPKKRNAKAQRSGSGSDVIRSVAERGPQDYNDEEKRRHIGRLPDKRRNKRARRAKLGAPLKSIPLDNAIVNTMDVANDTEPDIVKCDVADNACDVDIIPDDVTRGPLVLDVTCGDNTAILFMRKLSTGSKGPCVYFEQNWLTPNEFQYVSGRESAKDWKRSIKHHGKSLKILVSRGLMCLKQRRCKCCTCEGRADDSADGSPLPSPADSGDPGESQNSTSPASLTGGGTERKRSGSTDNERGNGSADDSESEVNDQSMSTDNETETSEDRESGATSPNTSSTTSQCHTEITDVPDGAPSSVDSRSDEAGIAPASVKLPNLHNEYNSKMLLDDSHDYDDDDDDDIGADVTISVNNAISALADEITKSPDYGQESPEVTTNDKNGRTSDYECDDVETEDYGAEDEDSLHGNGHAESVFSNGNSLFASDSPKKMKRSQTGGKGKRKRKGHQRWTKKHESPNKKVKVGGESAMDADLDMLDNYILLQEKCQVDTGKTDFTETETTNRAVSVGEPVKCEDSVGMGDSEVKDSEQNHTLRDVDPVEIDKSTEYTDSGIDGLQNTGICENLDNNNELLINGGPKLELLSEESDSADSKPPEIDRKEHEIFDDNSIESVPKLESCVSESSSLDVPHSGCYRDKSPSEKTAAEVDDMNDNVVLPDKSKEINSNLKADDFESCSPLAVSYSGDNVKTMDSLIVPLSDLQPNEPPLALATDNMPSSAVEEDSNDQPITSQPELPVVPEPNRKYLNNLPQTPSPQSRDAYDSTKNDGVGSIAQVKSFVEAPVAASVVMNTDAVAPSMPTSLAITTAQAHTDPRPKKKGSKLMSIIDGLRSSSAPQSDPEKPVDVIAGSDLIDSQLLTHKSRKDSAPKQYCPTTKAHPTPNQVTELTTTVVRPTPTPPRTVVKRAAPREQKEKQTPVLHPPLKSTSVTHSVITPVRSGASGEPKPVKKASAPQTETLSRMDVMNSFPTVFPMPNPMFPYGLNLSPAVYASMMQNGLPLEWQLALMNRQLGPNELALLTSAMNHQSGYLSGKSQSKHILPPSAPYRSAATTGSSSTTSRASHASHHRATSSSTVTSVSSSSSRRDNVPQTNGRASQNTHQFYSPSPSPSPHRGSTSSRSEASNHQRSSSSRSVHPAFGVSKPSSDHRSYREALSQRAMASLQRSSTGDRKSASSLSWEDLRVAPQPPPIPPSNAHIRVPDPLDLTGRYSSATAPPQPRSSQPLSNSRHSASSGQPLDLSLRK